MRSHRQRLLHFCFLWPLLTCAAQAAVIPAGTPVEARLESTVRSATSKPGDAVVAVIKRTVRAGGEAVIPQGSRLIGRVETVTPADAASEGRVRLAFREIAFPDGRRSAAWITEAFSSAPRQSGRRYALSMAVGAVAGALVGGKSARVAGILGGTLAGFVIAGETAGQNMPDLTLKTGRTLRLQLGEDLTLE